MLWILELHRQWLPDNLGKSSLSEGQLFTVFTYSIAVLFTFKYTKASKSMMDSKVFLWSENYFEGNQTKIMGSCSVRWWWLRKKNFSYILLSQPATKLGQGNVFTPVYHSAHRRSLPYTPPGRPHLGRPPPGRQPPWADTPQADTSTRPDTPHGQTPPVQCMLGYGQQAGSMHPTGMQSCLIIYFTRNAIHFQISNHNFWLWDSYLLKSLF